MLSGTYLNVFERPKSGALEAKLDAKLTERDKGVECVFEVLANDWFVEGQWKVE